MKPLEQIVAENDRAAERELAEAEQAERDLERARQLSHWINLAEPVPAPPLRPCVRCGKLTSAPKDFKCHADHPQHVCPGHVVCQACREPARREREGIGAFMALLMMLGAGPDVGPRGPRRGN